MIMNTRQRKVKIKLVSRKIQIATQTLPSSENNVELSIKYKLAIITRNISA